MNSDDWTDKEVDPHGKDAKEAGSKMDSGKVNLFTHLFTYFPRALESVCRVSEFGARKYTRMGWASVPDGVDRYTDAMCRHISSEAKGVQTDSDSSLRHAAQVAWNALARLELMLQAEDAEELRQVELREEEK